MPRSKSSASSAIARRPKTAGRKPAVKGVRREIPASRRVTAPAARRKPARKISTHRLGTFNTEQCAAVSNGNLAPTYQWVAFVSSQTNADLQVQGTSPNQMAKFVHGTVMAVLVPPTMV